MSTNIRYACKLSCNYKLAFQSKHLKYYFEITEYLFNNYAVPNCSIKTEYEINCAFTMGDIESKDTTDFILNRKNK